MGWRHRTVKRYRLLQGGTVLREDLQSVRISAAQLGQQEGALAVIDHSEAEEQVNAVIEEVDVVIDPERGRENHHSLVPLSGIPGFQAEDEQRQGNAEAREFQSSILLSSQECF